MKTNPAPIPAMKTGFRIIATAAWLAAAVGISRGQGPVAPGELVAPRIEIAGGNVNFTVQPSVNGRKYQLQASESLATGTWQDLGNVVTGDGNNLVISTPFQPGTPLRFYRLALAAGPLVPEGFALIPAGSFLMGDQADPLVGAEDERPVHTVQVSAFFMGKYEVMNDQMVAALNWAYKTAGAERRAGQLRWPHCAMAAI